LSAYQGTDTTALAAEHQTEGVGEIGVEERSRRPAALRPIDPDTPLTQTLEGGRQIGHPATVDQEDGAGRRLEHRAGEGRAPVAGQEHGPHADGGRGAEHRTEVPGILDPIEVDFSQYDSWLEKYKEYKKDKSLGHFEQKLLKNHKDFAISQ